MMRKIGWMLCALVSIIALVAMCGGPVRSEQDGDMFDQSNYEALKDDPTLGPIIRAYHEQNAATVGARTKGLQRDSLQKKGFLLRTGDKLVCFGDSITAAQDGYVSIMQNLITAAYPDRKIQLINAGIGGHKVTDLLARVDSDVIAKKPNWVTISIGINDVWHGAKGVPLSDYIKKLDELVTKLTAAKIRVVMLTTTVIGEDPTTETNKKLVGYNMAIQEVAAAHGLMVVPMNESFVSAIKKGRGVDPNFKLTTDGVHPNAVGHYVMALTILKSLRFQEPEQ